MNNYIEQLKKELSEYESWSGLDKSVSVLDLLWENYQQSNPIDDGLIQQREAAIAPIFYELSITASDALSGLIVDLCTAYQRAALLEGIHIGVELAESLYKKGL